MPSGKALYRAIPTLGLSAAVVVLVAIGFSSYASLREAEESAQWVEHTHVVLRALEQIVANVADAESARRGYALTGDEELLVTFEPALQNVLDATADVIALVRDNPGQTRRMRNLRPLVERRLVLLREALAQTRAAHGEKGGISKEGHGLTVAIRRSVDQLVATEQQLLDARVDDATAHTASARRILVVGTSTSVLLAVLAVLLLQAEVRRSTRSENDLSLLLLLGELLEACRDMSEAQDVIGRLGPRFFPDDAGAVFLFQASRNLVDRKVTFGDAALLHGASVFAPDECWALRRGQTHELESGSAVQCAHIAEPLPRAALCVPLMAHGELIGVFHLVRKRPFTDELRQRIAVVCEQVSLALGNLTLRETLRNQSIRDPLTGLFNRRYLEETLERDLRRAARESAPLCVLVIDVDHFKRFNDSFGHDAGDHVLRQLAETLTRHTRGGDIVSRLGGEELVVELPSATLEAGLAKAEELRAAVARMTLAHRNVALGQVTISLGVAAFPRHGDTGEALLRAADAALYRAKHAGRDRALAAE